MGESFIDINHVMKLAKLDLTGEDSVHYSSELNKILDYIDMLKGADTSGLKDIAEDLEYEALTSGAPLDTGFYKDCRQDECAVDASYDFETVKRIAPSFEAVPGAGAKRRPAELTPGTEDVSCTEYGFFVVPQVIE